LPGLLRRVGSDTNGLRIGLDQLLDNGLVDVDTQANSSAAHEAAATALASIATATAAATAVPRDPRPALPSSSRPAAGAKAAVPEPSANQRPATARASAPPGQTRRKPPNHKPRQAWASHTAPTAATATATAEPAATDAAGGDEAAAAAGGGGHTRQRRERKPAVPKQQKRSRGRRGAVSEGDHGVVRGKKRVMFGGAEPIPSPAAKRAHSGGDGGGDDDQKRRKNTAWGADGAAGERAVASFCAAVLTGICLGNVSSCHEILRAQRPGSDDVGGDGAEKENAAPPRRNALLPTLSDMDESECTAPPAGEAGGGCGGGEGGGVQAITPRSCSRGERPSHPLARVAGGAVWVREGLLGGRRGVSSRVMRSCPWWSWC
jgi:hypothetical protein